MAKQTPYVIDHDGFRLEWFRRRSELEVNVYRIEPDGTRGALVTELCYPKLAGVGLSDFTPEAVAIAKREIAQKENEPSQRSAASAV